MALIVLRVLVAKSGISRLISRLVRPLARSAGENVTFFCTVQPLVIFRARQPPLAGVAQGQNDGPGGQEHGPSGQGLAGVVWGINAAVSCGRPLVCCRRFGEPLAVLAL